MKQNARIISIRGFTLVEVLVALVIVALGLTALMITVSSSARSSGYLRDKALAQWIALNRLVEVRLSLKQSGLYADAAELEYANRHWHYDTRYFDTSNASMRRVVVRVWAGDAKATGNPLAESSTFLGSALMPAGSSNNPAIGDWAAITAQGAGSPGGPGTPGGVPIPGGAVPKNGGGG